MQFAPQIAPLVLLSTYRPTAVWIQFLSFQSCKHTVSCSWCCQADCSHCLLTVNIALYLHNSTSHHEHSYSKYVLADCSLIFSFLSNYDLSCVYSNSTVGAKAHCFTDVILQAIHLTVPQVPLDSSNSLTEFLIHWYNVLIIQAIQQNKTQYYYIKFSQYRKAVKFTVMYDQLIWYKYVQDGPRT